MMAEVGTSIANASRYYFEPLRETMPRESLARLHASSGTTGKSTVVGYTENDLRTWADLMARSIVKKPDEIPRSQGKAVRVRDLRLKE